MRKYTNLIEKRQLYICIYTQKAVRNGTAFCISGEPEYIVAFYFMYSATWSTGTIASLKM